MKKIRERGFSAVELLITLFIGAIFLLSGYQLYNYAYKSNADSDQLAQASNYAYLLLRQYAPQVASGSLCPTGYGLLTPPGVVNNASIGTLTNASYRVDVNCPYAGNPSLAQVIATVKYGTPQKQVSHATYVSEE